MSRNMISKTPIYKYEDAMSNNLRPESESDLYSHRIWGSNIIVRKPRNVLVEREWDSLAIGTLSAVVIVHVLALFAPFAFSWSAFWVAVMLYLVTALLGICLSYHRNLCHKSFKIPKWLEYFFAYCGVLALQGDPINWVSTHRYHHQFCDSEQDPHSPIEGFWFSHMIWLFDNRSDKEKFGEASNVGDLEKQLFYRWVAMLSFGEGWHNNHHAFGYSARHGLEWWQVDMTWYTIKFLQVTGLAKDIKLPTEVHKQRLALAVDSKVA
ncbi:Palmitoyl-monogalactosyldiacylglycerol delta-7 desaturase chloroplastic [Bienertia sinuspersici]